MKGWLGIAAYVAAYDAYVAATGRPTLSSEFCTTAQKHPVLTTLFTSYLVMHLYGKWPKKADPLVGYVRAGGWVVSRLKWVDHT